MLLHIFRRIFYMQAICLGFCYSVQGTSIRPVLSSSMIDDVSSHYETSDWNWKSNSFASSPTDTTKFSTTSEQFNSNTPHQLTISSFSDIPMYLTAKALPSLPSEMFNTVSVLPSESIYYSNLNSHNSQDAHLSSSSDSILSTVDKHTKDIGSILGTNIKVSTTMTTETPSLKFITQSTSEISPLHHFHTPLMSLLVASSSIPFPTHEESQGYFLPHTSLSPHSMTTMYNESTNSDLPLAPETEHKKLLMLVLRAEDCSKLSKVDFEKMLGKLMTKFGFGDAVPEVSNAKCFSHLHINLTVSGETPTLRFLPNLDDKHNVTVDVLNRTFRVVKLEKIDLKFEKSKSTNSSTIITSVAGHESIAYVSVGVTFGLVLVLCITMCCIKCCCLRKSQKRFGTVTKNAHVRLRPEDYTLTPIPRPTSLYVDYYRGSVTADIYSTTSAGSIASTTPTVDQGIIQPFDTSIIPLEDSSTLPLDRSRDLSVESVPVQSDLKTFNIPGLAVKGMRITSTDSKEQLNPKQNSRKVGNKTSGVANPTFQRY